MKYEVELDIEDVDSICVMTENDDDGIVMKYVPVKPIKEGEPIRECEPYNRWRAKHHQFYWFITSMYTVTSTVDACTSNDDARYENGNYFKTKEKAEYALERLKVMNELEVYSAKEIDKDTPYWSIMCDRSNNNSWIHVTTPANTISTYPFMFASKEDAEAAIEAVGKERLKKYFFRLEEENNAG